MLLRGNPVRFRFRTVAPKTHDRHRASRMSGLSFYWLWFPTNNLGNANESVWLEHGYAIRLCTLYANNITINNPWTTLHNVVMKVKWNFYRVNSTLISLFRNCYSAFCGDETLRFFRFVTEIFCGTIQSFLTKIIWYFLYVVLQKNSNWISFCCFTIISCKKQKVSWKTVSKGA